MTAAQRGYLHRLTHPQAAPAPTPDINLLQHLVDGIADPAVVYDHRWTVLAANQAARTVMPPRLTNLIGWAIGPGGRRTIADWPTEVGELVARWRTIQSYFPYDPAVEAAMAAACSKHATTAAGWESAAVVDDPAVKVWRVQTAGGRTAGFREVVMWVGPSPSTRLSVLS